MVLTKPLIRLKTFLILRSARRARVEGRTAASRRLAIAALVIAFGVAAVPAAHAADPDGLWKLVHGHCVPNEEQNGKPAPCALVDLKEGEARGYVVLKDLVGKTQYLVIPTAKVTGIE